MRPREKLLAIFLILIVGVGFLLWSIPLLLPQEGSNRITLATTTSTDNSGLLEFLHPIMTNDTGGLEVDVVAVGTGAAIEQARRGLADVVIVHNRELEDQFVKDGFGFHRVDLMYNDFILVGPESDPAGVKGITNSSEIFRRIYGERANSSFMSRGDGSGTHLKELELWEAAGVSIGSENSSWVGENPWYLESGSGMGETLTLASVSQSYTLTDRGTWLFVMERLSSLVLLASGPLEWHNPYGAMLVNPTKFPSGTIKLDAAKKYIQWLISDKGQNLIDTYLIGGEQAFFADFANHLSEMSGSEKEFWGINGN
ncbi:MAG: substrate-binding domain-containing protein [Candidatus Heimdallarchaeota archaeon]